MDPVSMADLATTNKTVVAIHIHIHIHNHGRPIRQCTVSYHLSTKSIISILTHFLPQ